MPQSREIEHALHSLRDLIANGDLDATASMLFLDALPAWLAGHFSKEIDVVRAALVAVPLGDYRNRSFARFQLSKLLLKLEALDFKTT